MKKHIPLHISSRCVFSVAERKRATNTGSRRANAATNNCNTINNHTDCKHNSSTVNLDQHI